MRGSGFVCSTTTTTDHLTLESGFCIFRDLLSEDVIDRWATGGWAGVGGEGGGGVRVVVPASAASFVW